MAGEYRAYVAQLVRAWAIANLSIKLQRKPTEAEIARWIQSLLRAHERERLKAAADRARLLGGRVRTEKGSRLVPLAPPVPLGPCEHGWLTGTAPNWTIYTWSALAAYLAAQGISIGSAGEYGSVVPSRATPLDNPRLYSGLGRLLAQSLVGAGRTIASILPPGWAADPLAIGCVRSPGGVYWVTKAAADGIYAARLTTPAAGAELAALAEGGTLTGLEQEIADARVLGAQELALISGAPDVVELVGAADGDLADFYDDYAISIAWGWCWRHQRRGAADEHGGGAVCTNYRAIDTASVSDRHNSFDLRTQLATLTLTWDGEDRPSGSVSLGSEHAYFLGGQASETTRKNLLLLSVDDQSKLSRRHNQKSTTASFTATGPPHHVAAWYGPDGDLLSITWTPDGSPVTESYYTGDPIAPQAYAYACYPDSPDIGGYVYRTGAYRRGHWTVAGRELDRVPYGVESVETWHLEAFYMFTSGSTGRIYVGARNTRGRTYSSSNDASEYEHLIVADSPGVAWIVGEAQYATAFEYSGCVEESLPTQWWWNCVYSYYTLPVDCAAGLNTSPRAIDATGFGVVNGADFALPGTIRDAMLSAAATLQAGAVEVAFSALSAPGYSGRNNVLGTSLPDGLDAPGAALAGRWIGAA